MGFRGGGTTITNYGGAPPAVAAASAGGGASTASRSDHTHAHTAALHAAGAEADLTGLFIALVQKAAINGVASLDGTGKVPAAQSIVQSVAGKVGAVTLVVGDVTNAESTANKGAVNGYASLDGSGLVPAGQLPSIVLTDTYVVASQAAMLALAAHMGDVAVRTDVTKSFILAGTNPAVLANWQELLSPTSAVTSVAGRTGAITLAVADVTNAESTANKGAANGYAGLGAGALVPPAQLGTGTADASHFLTGAGTFAVPATGAAAFYGAKVHTSTQLNVLTSTSTLVPFDVEDIDNGGGGNGYHDNVTNNSRLTVPALRAGYHRAYWAFDWYDDSAAGSRETNVLVNGTAVLTMRQPSFNSGLDIPSVGSIDVLLAVGDYVQLQLWQNSGTTRIVRSAGQYTGQACFGITYIGPAGA